MRDNEGKQLGICQGVYRRDHKNQHTQSLFVFLLISKGVGMVNFCDKKLEANDSPVPYCRTFKKGFLSFFFLKKGLPLYNLI